MGIQSGKIVTFPAKICKKNVRIKTDIINSDLPLLLSESKMKKANVKIDFSNDTISMLDQEVSTVLPSSGHYVPISKTNQPAEDPERNNKVGRVYLTIRELVRKLHD